MGWDIKISFFVILPSEGLNLHKVLELSVILETHDQGNVRLSIKSLVLNGCGLHAGMSVKPLSWLQWENLPFIF